MTHEEESSLSTFTLLLVPADPISTTRAWSEVLEALAELHPEQVEQGLQITLVAPHRVNAMLLAFNSWKEQVKLLGHGSVAVHLKLIDGQPPKPGAPPPAPKRAATGEYWLRFMPDFEAAPALWYLDPDDIDGGDYGLAEHLLGSLSPDLTRRIEGWIADWSDWHDCDEEDAAPPDRWLTEGELILQQLRSELEPLGYRIVPRML